MEEKEAKDETLNMKRQTEWQKEDLKEQPTLGPRFCITQNEEQPIPPFARPLTKTDTDAGWRDDPSLERLSRAPRFVMESSLPSIWSHGPLWQSSETWPPRDLAC